MLYHRLFATCIRCVIENASVPALCCTVCTAVSDILRSLQVAVQRLGVSSPRTAFSIERQAQRASYFRFAARKQPRSLFSPASAPVGTPGPTAPVPAGDALPLQLPLKLKLEAALYALLNVPTTRSSKEEIKQIKH
ncbi:hypothetical protein PR002_g17474 [Phytophthora rubi]|uniref:Uncharacterized protein n=1 Tax=Phytophthora rubi TaxID=129364 RepID=A0A6A3KGU0_9STRA|nr:hypothetical protein PR002_g17474 [Phytophthora rubi]